MFVKLGSQYVRLIGDPHFGKKFVNGVPLERRGEREAEQAASFFNLMNELEGPDGVEVKEVIIMGDLFDSFTVDNEVLIRVYELMLQAAFNHEGNVHYSVLMGNHDGSRNLDEISSFEILERMLLHIPNVSFIRKKKEVILSDNEKILLCPYDFFIPTAEGFANFKGSYVAVLGHWDVITVENKHNAIPVEELSKGTKLIITGHDHTRRTIPHGDVTVMVTGSMQPYSHGEDPTGILYVTKTLDEYEADPTLYHNKCLRLKLKAGEFPPEDVDALQFTYQYVTVAEIEETEVKMEEFSFKTLFEETFKANGLDQATIDVQWANYTERNSDATQT